MTLKQKSIIISIGTSIVFTLLFSGSVYQAIITQFQRIEDQRVGRNIRRVSAVLDDRFAQLSSKLTDWSNWDDTYKFIQDGNNEYVVSNLIPESFKNIGVDESLFINKEGGLVASIISIDEEHPDDKFPADLYVSFATGSALLNIKDQGHNQGLLKTEDGLLLFVVREVYKSDSTGNSQGYVVFARYLDDAILNSVKDLTQFEATMHLWDDPSTPPDYQDIKEKYLASGVMSLTKTISENTIAGYLIIKDIYGAPQAIVRTDIERDIFLQGKATVNTMAIIIAILSILVAAINYWLLTGTVLRKISLMAYDVENLGKTSLSTDRLQISKGTDEVDTLRTKINEMLNSLDESKSKLTDKEQFIEQVMANLSIGISVNKVSTGEAIYMNNAFQNIYGWTKEDITSVETFFNKVYPDPSYRQTIQDRVMNDINSGDINRMHWEGLEIVKKDGEKRYIDARNVPLLNQDLMVSTVVDVTDRFIKDQKREEYAKDLERLNQAMVDRELRMINLKQQLAEATANKS